MAHHPYDTMQPDDVTTIDLAELMRAVERCAGARVKDEIRITVLANAPAGPPSYSAVLTDGDGARTFRGTGVIPDVLAWLLENHDPGGPVAAIHLAWMVGDKEIAFESAHNGASLAAG